MSFITDIFGGDKPDYSQAEFQPYSIKGPAGGISYQGKTGTIELSPELQALYARFTGAATEALPSPEQIDFANQVSQYGQGLFGQAANLDTQGMTSDYYNRVIAGLNPQREAENVSLANTLFSQGRTGAGAGVEGGYINPEQFALFRAREEANKNIYLGAEDRARQIQMDKLKNALGYYGTGQELKTQPYATSANLLGYGTGLFSAVNPYITPSVQLGQAGAEAGGRIVGAQQQGYGQNLGFWGGLLGGG
jgi:hypothetical protein